VPKVTPCGDSVSGLTWRTQGQTANEYEDQKLRRRDLDDPWRTPDLSGCRFECPGRPECGGGRSRERQTEAAI
jgi:hypothetical protein